MQPDRWGARSSGLPVGTLTFFRSDVEGSMGLARALGARYDEANAAHHAIVREAITRNDGQVVRTEGDAAFAVFTETPAAARAAIEVQRAMAAHDWPGGRAFKVRIGLHAGTARRAGDDYGGYEVSRAARIADLGWGGQTVLSDAARGLLVEELDDDWSVLDLGGHRLRGIVDPERLYQLTAGGLPAEFPPLRTGSTATDHLPERLTSMIGRERELDALGALLAETRLLTLTGPGGIGKTTLAIELARRHADAYADGAWFVDLQGVRDSADVASELAHGLGLLDGAVGPAADRLLAYVAERELLVVIDNFEQVIEASSIAVDMLTMSPGSRLVVTSRLPLRLSSEQEYPVRPLALAADGTAPSEAVRFFIDRATRVRPESSLEAEIATVEAICRHLDGLPLAIELAAGCVSVLPIRAIHDRLAEHVPLPGVGLRDLPERQRTIEATVAWSHDLLDPPLQRLLARLGVFEDSFELEQAEAVCGPGLGIDVLEGLTMLVDHSLLFRMEDAIGGIRFGMLETIRAYAAERLGASDEGAEVRTRHLAAFHALVERDWPIIDPVESASLIDRVEPDEANLRAAVATAVEFEEADIALRMAGLLWRPWLVLGRLADGRALTARALALPGAEARARVMALDAAGGVAYWSGDLATARACYEEQLRIAEERDDGPAVAMAAVNLYYTRFFDRDDQGAEAALTLARRSAETLGIPALLAVVDIASRVLPLFQAAYHDPHASRPELEATTIRFESMADPAYRPLALACRYHLSRIDGDLSLAAESLVGSVRALLAVRDLADAVLYLAAFSSFPTHDAGLAEVVATVMGAAHHAMERLGIAPPMDLDWYGPGDKTQELIGALGAAGYESAFDRGRRMTLAEATDYIEEASEQLSR